MHSVLRHVHNGEVTGLYGSLLKTIMSEANPFSSKSTTHGKENEPLDRKDFATLFKASHRNVKVKETGT